MEYFENSDFLVSLLNQYGSLILFALLVCGIVALPVPEETLMVISGMLMAKGHLDITSTILAAYLGSISGITVSYLLGLTAGAYLLHKYQSWIGVTDKHISYVRRYGKWALFIGYFIPGVRHLSGLSFGMAESSYKEFALYAYSGAIVWSSTFLAIGYFFGDYALHLFEHLELSMQHVFYVISAIAAIYIVYKVVKHLKEEKSQH